MILLYVAPEVVFFLLLLSVNRFNPLPMGRFAFLTFGGPPLFLASFFVPSPLPRTILLRRGKGGVSEKLEEDRFKESIIYWHLTLQKLTVSRGERMYG